MNIPMNQKEAQSPLRLKNLSNNASPIKPDIPVILCTGFSDNITKDKAIAMGFRTFLMKPIEKNKLAVSIRNVLDNKR